MMSRVPIDPETTTAAARTKAESAQASPRRRIVPGQSPAPLSNFVRSCVQKPRRLDFQKGREPKSRYEKRRVFERRGGLQAASGRPNQKSRSRWKYAPTGRPPPTFRIARLRRVCAETRFDRRP